MRYVLWLMTHLNSYLFEKMDLDLVGSVGHLIDTSMGVRPTVGEELSLIPRDRCFYYKTLSQGPGVPFSFEFH